MKINAECPYCQEIFTAETYEDHGTWVLHPGCNKSRVTVIETQTGETLFQLSVVGKPSQGLTEDYHIKLTPELKTLVLDCGPHIVRDHLAKLRNCDTVPANQ